MPTIRAICIYDRDDRSNAELPSDFSVRMLFKGKLFCWSQTMTQAEKELWTSLEHLALRKKKTS